MESAAQMPSEEQCDERFLSFSSDPQSLGIYEHADFWMQWFARAISTALWLGTAAVFPEPPEDTEQNRRAFSVSCEDKITELRQGHKIMEVKVTRAKAVPLWWVPLVTKVTSMKLSTTPNYKQTTHIYMESIAVG